MSDPIVTDICMSLRGACFPQQRSFFLQTVCPSVYHTIRDDIDEDNTNVSAE